MNIPSESIVTFVGFHDTEYTTTTTTTSTTTSTTTTTGSATTGALFAKWSCGKNPASDSDVCAESYVSAECTEVGVRCGKGQKVCHLHACPGTPPTTITTAVNTAITTTASCMPKGDVCPCNGAGECSGCCSGHCAVRNPHSTLKCWTP